MAEPNRRAPSTVPTGLALCFWMVSPSTEVLGYSRPPLPGLRMRQGRTARPRFDVEQSKQLLLGEAQRRRRTILANHLLEQLPFLFEHLGDAALDRVLADEALDEYRFLLAQAMRAVDRLVLDRRV